MSCNDPKNQEVEVDDIWRDSTGKRIKIIRRVESLCCGSCWIALDLDSGELMTMLKEQMDPLNWKKEI